MAASIAAGYDTYCIYNGSSYTDYLKWTAVTLEVDWQEPATQPSLSAATVEMGKTITINTPAVNSAYRHTLRYAFGGGNIGASTTYDVVVTVADKYNSLSIPRTLSTKSVLQSFKRSAGAAIGKVAELANWLDIAWNTRIRGNLQVDGTISSADQYRIKWKTIPDGADLNDDVYKVPGHYRSILGVNKISNAPPSLSYGAFELVVTGISDGSYCTQTVKDFSNNRSWVRTQTTWQKPWFWTNWTEIITTDIGGDYYARLKSPNNLIHAGNEFTFAAPEHSSDIWLNYRTASGNTDGNIGTYLFGNGKGGLAPIKASGISADTLGWKRCGAASSRPAASQSQALKSTQLSS